MLHVAHPLCCPPPPHTHTAFHLCHVLQVQAQGYNMGSVFTASCTLQVLYPPHLVILLGYIPTPTHLPLPPFAPAMSFRYKPKVTTWGVFPRPQNISATYGGGRNIRPGQDLETPQQKAEREVCVDANCATLETAGLGVRSTQTYSPHPCPLNLELITTALLNPAGPICCRSSQVQEVGAHGHPV